MAAGGARVQLRQRAAGPDELELDALGGVGQQPARLREHGAARRAVEQARTGLPLEQLDLLADGGGRQVLGLGGGDELRDRKSVV